MERYLLSGRPTAVTILKAFGNEIEVRKIETNLTVLCCHHGKCDDKPSDMATKIYIAVTDKPIAEIAMAAGEVCLSPIASNVWVEGHKVINGLPENLTGYMHCIGVQNFRVFKED